MESTRRRSAAAFLVLLCTLAPGIALAQASRPAESVAVAVAGQTQELVLRDGSRAIGRVEKIENGHVIFRTGSGAIIDVPLDQVVSARSIDGRIVEGTYWRADPNPTRLFFAPTARAVAPGTGYFGVYEIFMPFVQVGVTDKFSMGGGTPLVFDGSAQPLWITPKLQVISGEETQAAVGVMHFFNIDRRSVGIAYAVVTHGSTDSAMTVGVGVPYYKSGSYHGGSALLMIGGEHRVSRVIKFVTENYVASGGGLASGGVRFIGERLSADVALMIPLSGDGFFAFPMVNFVWKFGK